MANSDKLFQKAEKLLQKRKFASALQIFLDLHNREPHNEAILLNLAELTLRLERAEDSLRYYRRLADLYMARKDVSRAIVTCRRILKSAPDDAQTRVKLALLLKQSGKRAECAEAFREAAEVFRRKADASHALDCLHHLVELEPNNLEAQIEFAELAEALGKASQAATALLRASEIARGDGKEGHWAELAQRAHQLDPSNKEARVTTAEICLLRNRAREAVALLEPISQVEPDSTAVLNLLCRAYLRLGEYAKAGPFCLFLYQRQPETIGLTEQLIRGLLSSGETALALQILEGIKEQMYGQQGKRSQFLALAEQIYHADENNLDVLELLPPLYNELNREHDLRLALARLFNLYLAGERYDKAADTLESVLDVDPYGAAHADRLLNLEGHIDATWYNNIASRISLPTIGRGLA